MAEMKGEEKTCEEVGISIPLNGRLDSRKNVKKEPRPFSELPPDVQRLLLNKRPEVDAETVLDKLSSKHMLTTLLYVAKMSPVMKSDIYNDVSRCSNMAEKIDTLYSMGLINIYQAVRTKSNIVVITERGRRVAETLEEMIDVIEGH